MICSNCGAECKENAKFCKNCGQELSKVEINQMRACPVCGTVANSKAMFCKKCGHKFDSEETYINSESGTVLLEDEGYAGHLSSSDRSYHTTCNADYTELREITEDQLPAKYRPLGAWAYFGWSLLFTCVPFGFIVAIVFAVGKTENVNLRNFARSMFCFLVVLVIILLLIFSSVGCSAGMLML